jgi:hypothetical protein
MKKVGEHIVNLNMLNTLKTCGGLGEDTLGTSHVHIKSLKIQKPQHLKGKQIGGLWFFTLYTYETTLKI